MGDWDRDRQGEVIRAWWSEVRRYNGESRGCGERAHAGNRIRKDAGTRVRELPGWWGYLCGGSLEEGMEEQIAKVEWWCLQGASHAHPEGGPDAETAIPVKQGRAGPAACFLSVSLFLPLCPSPSKSCVQGH